MAEIWPFACELYDREGVAKALLAMQDEHGLNIPLLLFCLWRGYAVGELTVEELAHARAVADAALETEVLPIRQRRRSLGKDHVLYAQVKELELAREQQLLSSLEMQWGRSTTPLPNGAGQAVANARAYLAAAGIPHTTENQQRLAVVFRHLPA